MDDAQPGLAGEQAGAGEAPVLAVDFRFIVEAGQLGQGKLAHRIGFAGQR